ncbi:MAG: mannose-1-phosphate guanylyltransferase, partial [Chitinispirillaceae bacterium]|nr:mannose-1-phosphate guanylyltransferase [Chitinispirillaceae bacterium]
MAGGKGERFWPLSTDERPKQFLPLISKDSMLQLTIKRVNKFIPLERIFIVTSQNYIDLIRKQLNGFPEENIIIEPVGRNTAPCVALSAFYINKIYPNSTLAVFPSDHLIRDEESFKKVIITAAEFVNKNPNSIVTIGIKPNRPETGYGYIKYNKTIDILNNYNIMKVEKFVEKPNKDLAKNYIDSGEYLWNAGMFIWKINNILNKTKELLPNTYEILSEIAATEENEFKNALKEKYFYTDNISIDYGIMEKSDNIYVIPTDFGWDDLGSWTSLERYKQKDELGNVCEGLVAINKAQNNIVITNKKTVLNGVENLIIVETDDYILISKKSLEQEIRV